MGTPGVERAIEVLRSLLTSDAEVASQYMGHLVRGEALVVLVSGKAPATTQQLLLAAFTEAGLADLVSFTRTDGLSFGAAD